MRRDVIKFELFLIDKLIDKIEGERFLHCEEEVSYVLEECVKHFNRLKNLKMNMDCIQLNKDTERVLKYIKKAQEKVCEGRPIPNFQSHCEKIKKIDRRFFRECVITLEKNDLIDADIKAHHIGEVSLTNLGYVYLDKCPFEIKRSMKKIKEFYINSIFR